MQTLDDFMYSGNETGFLAHRFYLFSVPIVYDYRDCDIVVQVPERNTPLKPPSRGIPAPQNRFQKTVFGYGLMQ